MSVLPRRFFCCARLRCRPQLGDFASSFAGLNLTRQFFWARRSGTAPLQGMQQMDKTQLTVAQQLAQVASALQQQRTGHAPRAVSVVLSEDTLVVTLHEALTPAEKALARSAAGAAQVQEFHRQLFTNSCDSMRQEIKRITGRDVREAAAEVETATGTVVHAFTTGAMVQVFLLADGSSLDGEPQGDSTILDERSDGDRFRVSLDASSSDDSIRSAQH
jgi:uncharacterized protein YbcI